MRTRFVVASTGHAGSAWLALALSCLGVPTTHEGVHALRGRFPWPARLAGDVSLAATRWLEETPADVARYVLVREPVHVLASFLRGYTFADTCPCHEPGAHLGSPLAEYVRSLGVDLESGSEIERTERYMLAVAERSTAAGATPLKIETLAAGGLCRLAYDLARVPGVETWKMLDSGIAPGDFNAHGWLGAPRALPTYEDVPALEALAREWGYR